MHSFCPHRISLSCSSKHGGAIVAPRHCCHQPSLRVHQSHVTGHSLSQLHGKLLSITETNAALSTVNISTTTTVGDSSNASSSTGSSSGAGHVSSSSITLEARSVGCLLGAMCGNALGAPVQNDRHWQVMRQFPDGLRDFWSFDLSQKAVKAGQYTGDFALLLASANSLISTGSCDAEHVAVELVTNCDPTKRRYGPYAELMLDAIASNVSLPDLPRLAEQYLEVATPRNANTATDRPEVEPYGPADNGGAARIAPIAIAYSDAGADVLENAVYEACLFSHTHPVGLDAARVTAHAIVWLIHNGSSSGGGGGGGSSSNDNPREFLEHLLSVAQTEDMQKKLQLLLESLFQLGPIAKWRELYCSEEWHCLTTVLSKVTYHGYATAGTEAVAVALWALVTSWEHPEQAVCMAATWGGSTPVTSQITGAFAGALHGDAWIPARWLQKLENDEGDGRDTVVAMAKQLARLGCTTVGLTEEQWQQLAGQLLQEVQEAEGELEEGEDMGEEGEEVQQQKQEQDNDGQKQGTEH